MEGIRQPILTYIYNRYGKASPKRDAVIELRIAFKNKQKYLSTGIRLLPKEWQRGRVVNRLDAAILNKTLDKLMNEVREVIYGMIEDGNIDIFAIPAKLAAKRRKAMTFLEFYAEKAEIRKHGIGKVAQGRYDLVPRVLEEFGRITSFSDLTSNNIIAFDKFLIKKDIKATSRWHNYHKYIRRFITEAIKEGFLERDPYDGVRLDHGNYDHSIEKFLTVEELKKLRDAKMPCERLERVRDLFIFQCYTCLSYEDLRRFDLSLITVENGRKIYYDHRKKSSVRLCFPLLGPALEVLERYHGLPQSLTIRGKTSGNILSNTNYNKYLKEIAEPAGLKKSLTTHWARHTGATMLLNAGVAPEVIAVVGGWANTKVLMKIYAKMQEKTVVKAVNDVEEKII
jgi:site-specific recombinase XerD